METPEKPKNWMEEMESEDWLLFEDRKNRNLNYFEPKGISHRHAFGELRHLAYGVKRLIYSNKHWIPPKFPAKIEDVGLENRDREDKFYLQRAWSDLIEPIMEYDSLLAEIKSSNLSNTKKKEEISDLNKWKDEVENELAGWEIGWDKEASEEEKKQILKNLEQEFGLGFPSEERGEEA